MESFFYLYMYLLNGELPWTKSCNEVKEYLSRMKQFKEAFNIVKQYKNEQTLDQLWPNLHGTIISD